MAPRIVAMRCFAEQSRGTWQAHCVDLGLTVRGNSLDEVRTALDGLVRRVLDAGHAGGRSSRPLRAPVSRTRLLLRYLALRLSGLLGLREDRLRPLPQPVRARVTVVR